MLKWLSFPSPAKTNSKILFHNLSIVSQNYGFLRLVPGFPSSDVFEKQLKVGSKGQNSYK